MTSRKSSGLVSFERLPVVDVSALAEPVGADRRATVLALKRAASEVGFLYVSGHGVDAAAVHAVEEVARAFFALPQAAKLRYHIRGSPNHRGYVPPGEEVFYAATEDTKEAFDLAREVSDFAPGPLCKFLGPNQWPREVPDFSRVVQRYYGEVFELGRRLLSAFAEALELDADFFAAHLVCPPSQLRLIHYPPAPALERSMGIGEHTDYECLTLLHSTAPGLEVKNARGDWVPAPPLPGAFVVNIGDLLEIWSNGTFVSTFHRVRAVSEHRYSFPLFFNVDYDTVVEPLAHLCSEGTRYEPLVSGEHLLAQTVQSFRYLVERRKSGLILLPEQARQLASFGHQATPRDQS